ncbi:MAG: peroxiredoxin-like family protein [Pseudomonadota bacterium]|nr:peroxiredoxin-like family protein [Pseudomonadota bacterium]
MKGQDFARQLEVCLERCERMDGPLSERLAAFADDVRRLSPEFADIVDRMISRLNAGGAGSAAPGVGDAFPPFLLPDDNGRLISLAQLLKDGPVVVSFQRGHWCHYCRMNSAALAAADREIRDRGGRIVVITPEVQEFARGLKNEAEAAYPVLSDMDNGYALELNLAIKIHDEKRQAMTNAGWDISRFQDNAGWTLPIPATFVVGQDGVVKARFVDPDYRKRMDIEEILAALN